MTHIIQDLINGDYHIITDLLSGNYLVSDKGLHSPKEQYRLAFIDRYSLSDPESSIDIYPNTEYGKIIYRNTANDLQLHMGLVTQINRALALSTTTDTLEQVRNVHTLSDYVSSLKFTHQYVRELVMTKVGEQTGLPINSTGITLLPHGRTLWVELDFFNRPDCTISIVVQAPLARKFHKHTYQQIEYTNVSNRRLSHAASPRSKAVMSRLTFTVPHNGWVTDCESDQTLSIHVLADMISPAVQDLLTRHEEWVCQVAEGYSRQFATPIRRIQKNILDPWLPDDAQDYIVFDRRQNLLLTSPLISTSLIPHIPVSLEIRYDLDGDNHSYEVGVEVSYFDSNLGGSSTVGYEKKVEGLPTFQSVEAIAKELATHLSENA